MMSGCFRNVNFRTFQAARVCPMGSLPEQVNSISQRQLITSRTTVLRLLQDILILHLELASRQPPLPSAELYPFPQHALNSIGCPASLLRRNTCPESRTVSRGCSQRISELQCFECSRYTTLQLYVSKLSPPINAIANRTLQQMLRQREGEHQGSIRRL